MLRSFKRISLGPRPLWMVHNMKHLYGEKVLAPRPTPKLEDHPLSAVRGCLFNIFAAIFHTGGRSTTRNLRTRHSVVTGTHLSWLDVVGDEKTSARRNLRSVTSSPYTSPYTDYATPALYIKELGNTEAPSAGCKNICLTTRSNKVLGIWHLWSLKLRLLCRKVLTGCFVPYVVSDLKLHVQFHHLHEKKWIILIPRVGHAVAQLVEALC
jgi:hypothetical protein